MGKARVLIVAAPDQVHKFVFSNRCAEELGLETQIANRNEILWKQAASWDVVCVEQYDTVERNWRDDIAELRRASPAMPVILLARTGSEQLAIESLRLGLADYVPSPWSQEALAEAAQRCVSKKVAQDGKADHNAARPSASSRMLGTNPNIARLRSYLADVARADATVLITGETGTGKELAAEFIHENSLRGNKPFVCINCAAIPDPLLESELFGHTKGAFTGAEALRDGLLSAADGGTIFLDEIGDMSLFAQAKILRVLETKEVHQLGGARRIRLNVRFVAATNRDLEAMTASGAFRKDLYFRLNVVPVKLPPLRERRDDIPLLVEQFCRERCPARAECGPKFSEECLNCFLQYDWPGNIRELRNVLESLFLGHLPNSFCPEHLPEKLRGLIEAHNQLPSNERELLVKALWSERWNKSRAAAKLNWSRMTLYRKMAKYRISPIGSGVDDRSPAHSCGPQPA